MFGMEFYRALGPLAPEYSTQIYGTYLSQAGFSPDIIAQKCRVFGLYADADASPEVMPNYGDNGISQPLSIHLYYDVLCAMQYCPMLYCVTPFHT